MTNAIESAKKKRFDMEVRIGTRRSLLAVTQSSGFARLLAQTHPEVKTSLVGIETEGDRIRDIPLQEVDGKDFFVKELDRSLLSKDSDLSVHSLKDLSLTRPKDITVACIPKREDPRDIVFFSDSVLERLREGKPLRIGSSSPRRAHNIKPFLEQSLPHLHATPPQVNWIPIRGNVPTRLARISADLDGVVLAVAGIQRLFQDPTSAATLLPLIEGAFVQVLPLSLNPTSPGQGALAVECRTEDDVLLQKLRTLHDDHTAQSVQIERKALAKWGGGCHQAFGASAVWTQSEQMWLRVLGKSESGEQLDLWTPQFELPTPLDKDAVFDGAKDRAHAVALEVDPLPPIREGVLWCTHSRAFPDIWKKALEENTALSMWTAGTRSWFELAQKGVWVTGCADSMGVDQEKLIPDFLKPTSQLYLTHDRSTRTDSILKTYRTEWTEPSTEGIEVVQSAKIFFWTSPDQYKQWMPYLNNNVSAQHCCGNGRTAHFLKNEGLDPLVFPSRNAWKGWLKSI